jgi:alkaline phosphatase
MRSIRISAFLVALLFVPRAAQPPVKNVILMIPDGTSTSVLSLARWFQWYKDRTKSALAIDPYLCGLVKTHSSNAPIGDSGPTSSWYATGEPSQTGFIAMYPPKDEADLVAVDATRSYQPLLTVLEGAKLSGKKTGLVFTCQFPHATPADFSAHWYDRQDYGIIGTQMVHNNLDVVFGGGTAFLTAHDRASLIERGYEVLLDDMAQFNRCDQIRKKLWALFGESDMPFDLDRNPSITPSLAMMASKALHILSKSEKGFFLMIEGSKIDWAAHANDPVGVISEFLAFDRAVDTAVCFARTDSHTVVIVCPDHGNSAISMGNRASNEGYDKLSLQQVLGPLPGCALTATGIADLLLQGSNPNSAFIQTQFNKCNPSITLSYPEIQAIINGYQRCKKNAAKGKDDFAKIIAEIITSRSFIGFTTHGHTGEDVFFAAYDPRGKNPHGLIRSDMVNQYLCASLGLTNDKGKSALKDSTAVYFEKYPVGPERPYKRVNKDTVALWDKDSLKFIRKSFDCRDTALPRIANGDIVLRVKKGGTIYTIPAYKDFYYFNAEMKPLKSVTVWVDKNNAFYMPKSMVTEIK